MICPYHFRITYLNPDPGTPFNRLSVHNNDLNINDLHLPKQIISQADSGSHSINNTNITPKDTAPHIIGQRQMVEESPLSSNMTQMSTALHVNTNISVGVEDWEQWLDLWSGCCVQVVLFLVMVAVCSVLGTVGNISVLLVYCKKTERRACNTFIKILAVMDMLVCAVIMPYTIVMELHLVTSDFVCRLFEFLRHVSITASNLTLVAIAVERYVAVCVIRHRLTVHNVNQGLVVVMGISVLVALPALGIFTLSTADQVQDVACDFPHHFEHHFIVCHFNPSLLGPVFTIAYQGFLMALFIITFIIIVILYALIHFSLWKRAKQRSNSSALKNDADANHLVAFMKLKGLANRGNEDLSSTSSSTSTSGSKVCRRVSMHRRTAFMLFVCTVVFLVTWLPFWVDVFSGTQNLCLRYMFFVGIASNPLVYSIANPEFRRSLLKLILLLKTHCTACKATRELPRAYVMTSSQDILG